MNDLFARLYEWFGLMPFYSNDMKDLLKGWDITCTGYTSTPWYMYMGWLMFGLTIFFYVLQYNIIDSTRWNKKQHWWVFATVSLLLNFLIAFTVSFNLLQSENYCQELNISFADCIGFGISNAIWSLIIFLIITSPPFIRMKFSTNCRHTTFWKP